MEIKKIGDRAVVEYTDDEKAEGRMNYQTNTIKKAIFWALEQEIKVEDMKKKVKRSACGCEFIDYDNGQESKIVLPVCVHHKEGWNYTVIVGDHNRSYNQEINELLSWNGQDWIGQDGLIVDYAKSPNENNGE